MDIILNNAATIRDWLANADNADIDYPTDDDEETEDGEWQTI